MKKYIFVFALLSAAMTHADNQVYKKTHEISARDYHAIVTESEKEDIAYIINLMGMGSLTKIAKAQSSLRKAGKRIDHLHPFNFLLTIFLDEEMKVSMHAMKSRTWLFEEFYGGVRRGLSEEAKKDNLLDFIDDFAYQLDIPAKPVYSFIKSEDWDGLVKMLLKAIPLKEDDGRYNL